MKNLVIVSIVSSILFLTSCGQVYRPSMTPTPLFTEKGQFNLEGGYSKDGINVSGAAAVSPSLAIMANGQFNKQKVAINGLNSVPTNGTYGEFALGYYKSIQEGFSIEVYAGGGAGQCKDAYQPIDARYDENFSYNKFFIQPNIGYRSDYIGIVFTPRFAQVSGNYEGYSPILANNTSGILSKSKISFFSFEPTTTFEFGGKQFKGYLQAGLNVNKHNEYISTLFNYGMGIKYNFSVKKK